MLRTILVVDDSPTIRKIVELTFSDSDYRVETAASGREGLGAVESVRPDLVLADVDMPEPSGYELCRVIKGSGRPVPVVLLAGTFEPFDPEQARACGADAHLIKPFDSETLREKIRALFEPVAPPTRQPATAAPDPDLERALEDLESASAAADDAEDREGPPEEPAAATDGAEAPSPELVDAVARAVVGRLSAEVLREIAWEVVPKLATEIIRQRIRELERDDESPDG